MFFKKKKKIEQQKFIIKGLEHKIEILNEVIENVSSAILDCGTHVPHCSVVGRIIPPNTYKIVIGKVYVVRKDYQIMETFNYELSSSSSVAPIASIVVCDLLKDVKYIEKFKTLEDAEEFVKKSYTNLKREEVL